MLNDSRTHLRRPQPFSSSPLKLHRIRATVFFYGDFISRAKEVLPTHIQTTGKIPHVQQSLLSECLTNIGIHHLKDFAAVYERRLSTFYSSLDTTEPELARPGVEVRAF